jgi:hypothetical protein
MLWRGMYATDSDHQLNDADSSDHDDLSDNGLPTEFFKK